ncbi:Tol-Pal system beta propeller repeat protein TolB [Dongia sedimenti]|uniref:Tol-Pal system protein TolB n=1 Tax=Dongia sedimenti TaxID=3064282 RepID=A0ABU0YFK5_9PROT|nr:Tol-Pal system beta propeller repeat protein TolB [Rhodospirillaceae bacterium R-7]
MKRWTAMIAVLVTLVVPRLVLAEPTIILGVDHPPQPLPIAIPNFVGNGPDAQAGADIARVISADLERSGLFAPIDPKAFIQDNASTWQSPRFQDWKLINAQALIAGSTQILPNGQREVAFRLWDVFGGQQMHGLTFKSSPENWRRMAHKVADEVYKRITGEDGYFDTRIVYISESGPKDKRRKQLAIMDQDGENHKNLTDGSVLVLTPRFSPANQDITYMSYFNNKPRVYLFNISSGQQEVLGDFPGMTFAPRFSPDGSRVIMSMAQGGNTDIYVMDIRTRRSQRLTDSPAIDTSPCYSPDGSKVVFNSDRGGEQQLYVMGADGANVQRISKGNGRYATPVWSPRGDLIAFTKMAGGQFQIGVMRPDGSGERILNTAWLVEGPTWAPNGRVLAFFSQDQRGVTKLHSIDLTGYNERILKTPMDGSDPAWSPLLDNQ